MTFSVSVKSNGAVCAQGKVTLSGIAHNHLWFETIDLQSVGTSKTVAQLSLQVADDRDAEVPHGMDMKPDEIEQSRLWQYRELSKFQEGLKVAAQQSQKQTARMMMTIDDLAKKKLEDVMGKWGEDRLVMINIIRDLDAKITEVSKLIQTGQRAVHQTAKQYTAKQLEAEASLKRVMDEIAHQRQLSEQECENLKSKLAQSKSETVRVRKHAEKIAGDLAQKRSTVPSVEMKSLRRAIIQAQQDIKRWKDEKLGLTQMLNDESEQLDRTVKKVDQQKAAIRKDHSIGRSPNTDANQWFIDERMFLDREKRELSELRNAALKLV
jgi:predicted  nucleic acid-binding Zn-ribbon protein